MDSILQTEKKCFISGTTKDLHKHHIYPGTFRRQISDDNGFWIWLSGKYHNLSNEGIHFDKKFDLTVKQLCQRKYEETHSREEFIDLIGENFLTDKEEDWDDWI